MNKQNAKNFYYIATVVVTIGMVAAAEFSGQTEILFPEIGALAVGSFVAPKRSWQVSGIRMIACITICAFVGLFFSRYVTIPYEWLRITLAYLIAQTLLLLSGTSFAPMISALVLPVLLHTTSIVYPISAISLTTLIVCIRWILIKAGIKESEPFTPVHYQLKQELPLYVYRFVCVAVISIVAFASNHMFFIAPPILVAFTEFSKKESPVHKVPINAIMVIAIGAFAGAMFRWSMNTWFTLPMTVAATLALLVTLLTLTAFGLYIPPAGALTILAYLIPLEKVFTYPFDAMIGISIFMGLALLPYSKYNVLGKHSM